LDKVVSIWVFYQTAEVRYYHISKGKLLSLSALLKASLHHTAPMLVRANLNTGVHAGFKDELSVLLELLRAFDILIFRVLRCLEDTEEALDYMVAVYIQAELFDVVIEFLYYHQ
jgi:hypothetical protein